MDVVSNLNDIDNVNLNYSELTSKVLDEDSFGSRLRISRTKKGLDIQDISDICGVTRSVVNGYELDRYYPSKEILDKLSSVFDINYLCRDGYTYLVLNHDEFVDNLKNWIKNNNYTREVAATKLKVSRSLFRYWFNGGILRASLYNKIKDNLEKYDLL